MDEQWDKDIYVGYEQCQQIQGSNIDNQLIPPVALNSYPSDYSDPPMLAYSYSGISNASSNQDYHLSAFHYEQPTATLAFLEPQQLYNSIVKLVEQTNHTLLLDNDLTLYLLYRYKWNRIKLHEEYFDLTQLYHKKNGQILLYESIIKKQNKQQTCEICCEAHLLIPSPFCCHKYCRKCWQGYIKQQLEKGSIFFPCMQKCETSPTLPFVFVKRHYPQLLAVYQKKICIHYANINKQISYCPSTRNQNCSLFCEQPISLSMSLTAIVKWVECKCGEIYCFQCRRQPHFPLSCEDVMKWIKVSDVEEGSIQWISKNTKKCPECKASVQKYIGCHYIKCVCGAEFCFQCTKSWDDNHRNHRGQCLLLSMKKKSSLEERTSTHIFVQLQEKLMAINRTVKKNSATFNSLLHFIQTNFKEQEWAAQRIKEMKRDIQEIWGTYKWSLIGLFIYRKEPIDALIQDQFVDSITSLIDSIQKIEKLGKMISFRELLILKTDMASKRQLLNKNKNIWLDAWRSC